MKRVRDDTSKHTCDDFPGRCCESCHQEAAPHPDGFSMLPVFDERTALYADVCCNKKFLAVAKLVAETIRDRSASTPTSPASKRALLRKTAEEQCRNGASRNACLRKITPDDRCHHATYLAPTRRSFFVAEQVAPGSLHCLAPWSRFAPTSGFRDVGWCSPRGAGLPWVGR